MIDISLISPIYNEAKYIALFIESIQEQDYSGSWELLLIDGGSTDGTQTIIKQYQDKFNNIRLLNNPHKTTPFGMNIGIQAAKGNYVAILGAHASYPKNYISTLLHYLETLPGAQNVGGVCRTLPANDSLVARAIATALSHPFGVGNATFRIGAKNICQVDTVPFGCWRKTWFDTIGGFDEELTRNQDDEFNARTIEAGGKIYLIPSVVCDYYARATMKQLWQMYYQYGLFKPFVNSKLHRPATIRQFVPPLFVLGFLFVWPLYLLVTLLIAIKKRNIYLIPAFTTLHLSYGLGYWVGLYKVLCKKNNNIHVDSNH